MKYRSSYGQNLLQHSREVAKLCGVMAAELGLNPKIAKRAGLLHDIGKVPDAEADMETPHAILGMQWAEKFGEKDEVCNAIGAHHDEVEMKFLISPVIQVCDAISGARPGARRQVLDSYIQRLKDLEDIAFGFTGVKKAYAIQAGRELRVIVESEKVDDQKAADLSFSISQKVRIDKKTSRRFHGSTQKKIICAQSKKMSGHQRNQREKTEANEEKHPADFTDQRRKK